MTARNFDRERYNELCSLIDCAVEEAKMVEEVEPDEILIAVSPDCETVMCTLCGRWEDPTYHPKEDWKQYHGFDVEDLCEQVYDNFDFRS